MIFLGPELASSEIAYSISNDVLEQLITLH